MRVLATPTLYTYPDLSVACNEPQFADSQVDTLNGPLRFGLASTAAM
jgi:hypothetical protein